MIYLADIQTVDDLARADQEYNENCAFLEEVDAELYLIESQRRSMQMFDLYTEEAQSRIGNAIVETCRKIGQKIMDIIRSITDYLSGIVAKWRSNAWGSKSVDEKVRQIARKNPKAAEQIKIAVTKGQLDFMSYSDFSDFYKHIDEIIDGINESNLNEKSIRGKWEKVKRKYLTDKSFKTVATVVGIAGTVTTTYVLWKRFKNESSNWEAEKILNNFKLIGQKVSNKAQKLSNKLTKQKIAGAKSDNKIKENTVDRLSKSNANEDTIYATNRCKAGQERLTYKRMKTDDAYQNSRTNVSRLMNVVDDVAAEQYGKSVSTAYQVMCEMMTAINAVNKDAIEKFGNFMKHAEREVDKALTAIIADGGQTPDGDDLVDLTASAVKTALGGELRRVDNNYGRSSTK